MNHHLKPISRPLPMKASCMNPCPAIIKMLNAEIPGASKLMDWFDCWLYNL